ncbi:glycoside hydrolase family 31 protein [Pseudovibrio sp. Tun.PSC04-5.I4]|uniref:glycoside hydrolase family 31 protein n=1 Tax=Pseudovibrio sp. Tun.PSC04-5.I4 TaxID=1798213 RepID=UPI00087E4441|nr:glycoside hydrolase family 31 protein [Pseudovibrio sp. Tun.PSC04-5.I4]SDQ72355.1 alpha-glucosidase [Pseudovibrio sp. Tun.PSC04-5.I4]
MKTLRKWSHIRTEQNQVDLLIDEKHLLSLFILEDKVVRVLLRKNGEFRQGRTWSITPGETAMPFEGRPRLSVEGFSLPEFRQELTEDTLVLETRALRVSVKTPLQIIWEAKKDDGSYELIASERPTGAYMLGLKDNKNSHFLSQPADDRIYGLGEKAGNLLRNGRRYEMRNLDAMGYDAETTDPLYKHLPFTLTRTASGISYGVFYDNLVNCWFDLGNEIDNYHRPHRSYRAEDGDLDYYFTLGPSLLDVTKTQVWLTGKHIFPPKWSLGYSGSTMYYTDADNAQEQLEGFIDLIDEHAIPCDSFQLSSGYTSIGSKRYVFNWNDDKCPDPKAMTSKFLNAGVHLAANIKPCLLQDHPMYKDVEAKGLFIRDSEADQPERSLYWDDEGSHLDFTNMDTVNWWKANVTEQLLERGIGSTWNDNNEYEIWDFSARCKGFGEEIEVGLIRPLHSLLMMRTSYEAQIEHAPDERPYLISRSGSPGLQRYVQTWTGDNRTNWNNLKYNIRMGLGLSMSGIYNVGHDVGGFSGPRPDPELFVRWVQNGVMHPRFTIHSWNDDATVNEPWMHPDVTPLIRNAMQLRQYLMPYFYTLLHDMHVKDEPLLRPTFLDHEGDERTYVETDDYLLGKDLLVASVVEQGATTRTVYLPDNGDGWYEFDTGVYHKGGQTIIVDAPLERLPLFVRAGTVIPLANPTAKNTSECDLNALAVFPFQGPGSRILIVFEDDGISHKWSEGQHSTLNLLLSANAVEQTLSLSRCGELDAGARNISIFIKGQSPNGLSSNVTVNGQCLSDGTLTLALTEL